MANPATAVGKISAYLARNPGKARYGYADLLRLAMSEEGFKTAEKKGEQKEKQRQQRVKKAAMESDEVNKGEEVPNASWSVEDIREYIDTHPDYKPTWER